LGGAGWEKKKHREASWLSIMGQLTLKKWKSRALAIKGKGRGGEEEGKKKKRGNRKSTAGKSVSKRKNTQGRPFRAKGRGRGVSSFKILWGRRGKKKPPRVKKRAGGTEGMGETRKHKRVKRVGKPV